MTNVIWWDEKNVYLTHKVITIKDNIIRAIIYARASCLHVDVFDVVRTLDQETQRPDVETVPPDYRKWMETLELSSQLMKANQVSGAGGDGDNVNNCHHRREDGEKCISPQDNGNDVEEFCKLVHQD